MDLKDEIKSLDLFAASNSHRIYIMWRLVSRNLYALFTKEIVKQATLFAQTDVPCRAPVVLADN